MPNHSNKSSSSIIGNCLNCQGLVRVATETKANATVRCPHCQTDFSLSDILAQTIPLLEVVAENHPENPTGFVFEPSVTDSEDDKPKYEPVTEKEDGRFVVPQILAQNARNTKQKNSLAKSERRSKQSSSARAKNSEDRTNAARSSRTDSGRNRSKSRGSERERTRTKARSGRGQKRNPFLELVMVALGACLSLPVAQLLIWWFLGSDPIGLAPRTADVAPFLVPIQLRGPIETDDLPLEELTPKPKLEPRPPVLESKETSPKHDSD